MNKPQQRRRKGEAQVRQEPRSGGKRWGYDITLRQDSGKRKRFRDFSFHSEQEAKKSLAALIVAGNKGRYGLNTPVEKTHTTVEAACADYITEAENKYLTNRTDDTRYHRDKPGHIHTLERFIAWIKPDTVVTTIRPKHFMEWIKHETLRAKQEEKSLKQSTIRRGLNTIRGALNHAVKSGEFKDLEAYKVPSNPLKKKVEKDRDRVLSDEEVSQITFKLKANPDYDEALFFFQLDLITGARMDELLRLTWDEASVRFGTIYLFSGKTGKDRTVRVPAAAKLVAKRKAANLGGPVNVLTKTDKYFRKIFRRVSKQLNIPYGQNTPGGWTIHDIRHTCLTNLALDGVPLHGIMEFAGHASITETQRYLKFMPEQIELAARSTTRLAQLANAEPTTNRRPTIDACCPNCDHTFEVELPQKGSHLSVVPKTGTRDQ